MSELPEGCGVVSRPEDLAEDAIGYWEVRRNEGDHDHILGWGATRAKAIAHALATLAAVPRTKCVRCGKPSTAPLPKDFCDDCWQRGKHAVHEGESMRSLNELNGPGPGESNGKKQRKLRPKKVHKDKLEKVVRTLRCDLTEKEVRERADRAAHLIAERDQKEADQKNAASHMKAQVKALDSELRKVSTEVRDRSCMRPVECEVRFDYRLGRVVTKRLDTKETIEERPMQAFERQTALPLEQDAAEQGLADHEPAPKKKRGRKPRAQQQATEQSSETPAE